MWMFLPLAGFLLWVLTRSAEGGVPTMPPNRLWNAEQWRGELAAAAPDLPIGFLLAWVAHESGGNPASAGIYNREAGIFQSYHPDDDRYGATFRELRAGAGPDYQSVGPDGKLHWHNSERVVNPGAVDRGAHVRSGVAMVRGARDVARRYVAQQKLGWSESSMDFWSLVKLYHALPGLLTFLPAYARAKGHPPANWREWRGWVEGLTTPEVIAVNPKVAPWSAPEQRKRLFDNAESAGRAVT